MKTIIYTPFDCIIKTEDAQHFVSRGENVSFDGEEKIFYVYPTGKSKTLPFAISTNDNLNFYRKVNHNGNNLIFLLDGLKIQETEIHHFSYNGKSSEIHISSEQLAFCTKSAKKTISLPFGSNDFKCGKAFHILYVTFKYADNQALLFYNTVNNKIKFFEGETIACNDNTFFVQLHDGEKIELYIDCEGLKTKQPAKPTTFNLSNPLFVAKNFMETIKKGDFSSALKYLSPALQKAHSSLSLQEYFGDVSYTFPLDLHTIFAISNNTEKIYSFEIDIDKITDIID